MISISNSTGTQRHQDGKCARDRQLHRVWARTLYFFFIATISARRQTSPSML